MSQQSVNSAKTPLTYKFSAKHFEFYLCNTNAYFNENKNKVDNKMQIAFSKFLNCLNLYLDLFEDDLIDETKIKIYGSVTLENGAIVRTTSSYHNKEWFSDIAISIDSEESNDYISDQGLCYGQVIIHQFV
jgi:hypothetical protein